MSAQIRSILAEERAREPAIGPCAALPLLTEEQMAGQDEMGEHLDREPVKSVEAEHPWLWLVYVLAAISAAVIPMVKGPGSW